jgi:hypothetical protein
MHAAVKATPAGAALAPIGRGEPAPAGFLDSWGGIRSIRYESDRSGASFSASSAIDRPTFSAILLGIDRRTGP